MAEPAFEARTSVTAADVVTALLVDADRSFVQFAREELNQSSGPPVCLLHAPTLADASAILADHDVGVLLLDEALPDGNGVEWLKSRRGSVQAAVLLLRHDVPRGTQLVWTAEEGQDVLVKTRLDGDRLAHAIRDAAHRERTRQQVLQTREHFQSLIEHARDLITVVDERGCIIYQSPASATLLGAPPHVHHGGSFVELVHPEDAARARQLIDDVLVDNLTPRGEFRLPHVDGAMRTVEVVASRFSRPGEPARAVLNGRDMTERRQAEASLRLRESQLRQAQKMEAVGRLAGGIAHDFSNVLTVIAGACERLQDDIAQGQATPAQVDVVLRHCARATALTRQLLAFSRHQTIAPRIVDLASLVQRSGELITQLIGERVRFDVDIEDGLHAVEIDPVQMEQVLMNLAINARDAMPGGGVLRIVGRNVAASPAFASQHPPMTPGDYVRLEVIDDGFGMSADTQARAFEPFFTTKDPTRGTGLGLATVYGIVTQSRGHVWIDSAPGRGTRFTIHLPVSATRSEEECAPESGSRTGIVVTPTILVTEDDPDLRELLSETLGARGYRVVEASGPADALDAVARCDGSIDLLLTDLMMPGGSGRELARRMRGTSPRLKVLFMSGYGEPGEGQGAQLGPGDPFLAKPFTRQQLLQAIGGLLG